MLSVRCLQFVVLCLASFAVSPYLFVVGCYLLLVLVCRCLLCVVCCMLFDRRRCCLLVVVRGVIVFGVGRC